MGTDDPRRSAAAMLVFAEVVATGSFTRAARRLGFSKASVSGEVARLERRLGVRALIDHLVETLGPEPEWDRFETARRARAGDGPRRRTRSASARGR